MVKSARVVKLFHKSISNSAKYIQNCQYEKARSSAQIKVKLCRRIILSEPISDENLKNISLVYGIIFRGFEELASLKEIVTREEWYRDHQSVERAWFLLQNCTERFESTLDITTIDQKIKEYINSFIQTLTNDFLKTYGPGIYCSPEIVIKKSCCSICKLDYRSCPHLPNHVYNGKICRMEPTEFEGHGVAMVNKPVDPRCRMWPWHGEETEDGGYLMKNIPLIISFRIDDFLD